MRVERRAVREARLVLAEDALEAEQERVPPPPVRRRHLGAGVDLREGGVQGQPPSRAGGERVREVLALVHETLTREDLGTRNGVRIRNGCGRGGRRRGISHGPACFRTVESRKRRHATRSPRQPAGIRGERVRTRHRPSPRVERRIPHRHPVDVPVWHSSPVSGGKLALGVGAIALVVVLVLGVSEASKEDRDAAQGHHELTAGEMPAAPRRRAARARRAAQPGERDPPRRAQGPAHPAAPPCAAIRRS